MKLNHIHANYEKLHLRHHTQFGLFAFASSDDRLHLLIFH